MCFIHMLLRFRGCRFGGMARLVVVGALLLVVVASVGAFEVVEMDLTESLPSSGCVNEHGLKCTSVESLVSSFEGIVNGRVSDVFLEEESSKLDDPEKSVTSQYQGPLDMMLSTPDDSPDSSVADPKPALKKKFHEDIAPTNSAIDEDELSMKKMAEEAQREVDLRLAKKEKENALKEERLAKEKAKQISREKREISREEHEYRHHGRQHHHHEGRRHYSHERHERHRIHNHGRHLRRHEEHLHLPELNEVAGSSTDMHCDTVSEATLKSKCEDVQAIAAIGDNMGGGTMKIDEGMNKLKEMGVEKLSLGDSSLKANWETMFGTICAGDLSSVKYGEGPDDGCGASLKKMIAGSVEEVGKATVAAGGKPPTLGSSTSAAGSSSSSGSTAESGDAESSIKEEIRAEVKKEIALAKEESEKRLKEELDKLKDQASGDLLSSGELGELYAKVSSGDVDKKDALKKMEDLGLNVKDLGEDDVPSVLKNLLKKDGPLVNIQVGLESGQMNKDEVIKKLKDNGIADPDDDTSVEELKKMLLKLAGETALAQHKIIQASTEKAIKAYMKKMEKEGGVSPKGIKKQVLTVIHELGANKTEVRTEGRKWRKSLGHVTDKKLNSILDKLKTGDLTFEDAAKELQKDGGAEAKLDKDAAIKFLTAELDARSTVRASLKRGGPGTVKSDLKKEIMKDMVHAQAAAAGRNDTEGGEGGNSTVPGVEKSIIEALKKQREDFKDEMKKEVGSLVQQATAKASINSIKMTNETVAELEDLKKKLESKEITSADARKKLEDLGLVEVNSILDDGVEGVIQAMIDHKKARDEDRDSLRKEVEELKAELTESVKSGAGNGGNGTNASASPTTKKDNIRTSLKNLFSKAENGTPQEVAELIKKQMESEGLVVTEGAADGSHKVKVDEASFEHAIYGESEGEMSFVCFVPQ